MLLLAILAELANAVYCAQLALERERNPLTWFLIGLLFGPLAVLTVMRWSAHD